MEMTVKNCKGIEGNQKFEKGKKKQVKRFYL